MLGNNIVLCIVGNKIDLEKDRHVSVDVAEEYARSVNAKLYHTSAKLNKGIEELFHDLASRTYLQMMTYVFHVYLFYLGMLEKTPATANESAIQRETVRSGGIAIQSTTDQNDRKTHASCC
jgi:Fe2+ transport system protein B